MALPTFRSTWKIVFTLRRKVSCHLANSVRVCHWEPATSRLSRPGNRRSPHSCLHQQDSPSVRAQLFNLFCLTLPVFRMVLEQPMRTYSHLLMTAAANRVLGKRIGFPLRESALLLGSFMPDIRLGVVTVVYLVVNRLNPAWMLDQQFDKLYFTDPIWII